MAKKWSKLTEHGLFDLSVEKQGDSYFLVIGGEPVTNRFGIRIEHRAEELLRHMAGEFGGHSELKFSGTELVEPDFFGAFRMYTVQKQWIEECTDDLSQDFASSLLRDPILNSVPGPESMIQSAYWSRAYNWAGKDDVMTLIARLERQKEREYEEIANEQGERSEKEDAELETRARNIAAKLEARYRALSPEERTAVMHLFAMSKSVLMPLALVSSAYNEAEYALGVMAAHGILAGALGTSVKDHDNAFDEIRGGARTAMDYIRYYRAG